MKPNSILLIVFILVLISFTAMGDVPIGQQAELMLKILSMDRNFSRSGPPVKIGVSSGDFLQKIQALRGKVDINGRNFIAEKMSSSKDIEKYNVIYCGKNWAGGYKAVSTEAIKNQVLMFCETEDGVLAGGGAVSYKVVDGKPNIVVNLKNAAAMGANFPVSTLRSAGNVILIEE